MIIAFVCAHNSFFHTQTAAAHYPCDNMEAKVFFFSHFGKFFWAIVLLMLAGTLVSLVQHFYLAQLFLLSFVPALLTLLIISIEISLVLKRPLEYLFKSFWFGLFAYVPTCTAQILLVIFFALLVNVNVTSMDAILAALYEYPMLGLVARLFFAIVVYAIVYEVAKYLILSRQVNMMQNDQDKDAPIAFPLYSMAIGVGFGALEALLATTLPVLALLYSNRLDQKKLDLLLEHQAFYAIFKHFVALLLQACTCLLMGTLLMRNKHLNNKWALPWLYAIAFHAFYRLFESMSDLIWASRIIAMLIVLVCAIFAISMYASFRSSYWSKIYVHDPELKQQLDKQKVPVKEEQAEVPAVILVEEDDTRPVEAAQQTVAT